MTSHLDYSNVVALEHDLQSEMSAECSISLVTGTSISSGHLLHQMKFTESYLADLCSYVWFSHILNSDALINTCLNWQGDDHGSDRTWLTAWSYAGCLWQMHSCKYAIKHDGATWRPVFASGELSFADRPPLTLACHLLKSASPCGRKSVPSIHLWRGPFSICSCCLVQLQEVGPSQK